MIPHDFNLSGNSDLLLPLLTASDSFTFPKFIEDISKNSEEAIRNMIKDFLEKMDRYYRDSSLRKQSYYVRDTRTRTIVTMYGEITYKRTIYKDRLTNKNYCYVDSKMGIDKYYRYTSDVGSYVYEAYSNENSMIKVGQEVGNLIYSKFSLSNNIKYSLPRQTIYNLIKRSKEARSLPSGDLKKIDDIYLLLDEKYIPCQDKLLEGQDRKDMMIKSCLIVEGLDKKEKRHKYLNPHYISVYGENEELISQIEDYLINRYDMDNIKHIHVLSDGGAWIEALYQDLSYPRSKKRRYLDKFHGFKAIWNICLDNDTYKELIEALYTSTKQEFFKVIDGLIEINKDKKETNKVHRDYLYKHYSQIKHTLELKDMNCAMEQVISHHIASQFTSVAKAYTSENINAYLALRDNFRNNENLKEIYLHSLNDKDNDGPLVLNAYKPNLSIFESPNNISGYKTKIKGGQGNPNPSSELGQEDNYN